MIISYGWYTSLYNNQMGGVPVSVNCIYFVVWVMCGEGIRLSFFCSNNNCCTIPLGNCYQFIHFCFILYDTKFYVSCICDGKGLPIIHKHYMLDWNRFVWTRRSPLDYSMLIWFWCRHLSIIVSQTPYYIVSYTGTDAGNRRCRANYTCAFAFIYYHSYSLDKF